MKKLNLTYNHINAYTSKLCREITNSNWRPDYVVGLTRGGLMPAVMISHYFDIPMHTLKVALRDHADTETNAWMADDAFGYVNEDERHLYGNCRWDIGKRKNILIVDDINDTGATFEWIKNDWQTSCLPNELSWNTVWNKTVRFAVMVENLSSNVKSDYAASEVNKSEEDVWVSFPWEIWWKQ